MKCRVALTAEGDRPYWIRRDAFQRCVDHENLACRDSTTVENFYLSNWFHENGGLIYFSVPAFYLEQGRAYFINGRHRTVLLSRYLALLPMALTQVDTRSAATLEQIAERAIALDESFDLPDLPVRDQ